MTHNDIDDVDIGLYQHDSNPAHFCGVEFLTFENTTTPLAPSDLLSLLMDTHRAGPSLSLCAGDQRRAHPPEDLLPSRGQPHAGGPAGNHQGKLTVPPSPETMR